MTLFSPTDKYDRHVTGFAPTALRFPSRVGLAPESLGLFILTDQADHVIYVGIAASVNLREKLQAFADSELAPEAVFFRWFGTKSVAGARLLFKKWLGKYQPVLNVGRAEEDAVGRVEVPLAVGSKAVHTEKTAQVLSAKRFDL